MQTIVNTVNTVGFMGAGIALEYKRRFPEMFYEYNNLCTSEELKELLGMITDIPVLISKTLQLFKKK